MTTNSLGTGGYPVPPVHLQTSDAEAENEVVEPEDATTDEVAEERDVVSNLDDPEVESAIEDLRPDAR